MPLRAKQTLAVLAGCLVAGVMMILGLWQMHSYEESTRDVSAERAASPSVDLAGSVTDSGVIDDIYGRRVTLSGQYVPQYQVLVGAASPWRVATVFQLQDGRYVTVVRGAAATREGVPEAPAGVQHLEGIFLASDKPAEGHADGTGGTGVLPTLRLQELAQDWPSPLIGGYVTLPRESSEAQGLTEATLELPPAEGSATHRGYALQWWVFAAGAIAVGIYGARGLGKDARAQQPDTID